MRACLHTCTLLPCKSIQQQHLRTVTQPTTQRGWLAHTTAHYCWHVRKRRPPEGRLALRFKRQIFPSHSELVTSPVTCCKVLRWTRGLADPGLTRLGTTTLRPTSVTPKLPMQPDWRATAASVSAVVCVHAWRWAQVCVCVFVSPFMASEFLIHQHLHVVSVRRGVQQRWDYFCVCACVCERARRSGDRLRCQPPIIRKMTHSFLTGIVLRVRIT